MQDYMSTWHSVHVRRGEFAHNHDIATHAYNKTLFPSQTNDAIVCDDIPQYL